MKLTNKHLFCTSCAFTLWLVASQAVAAPDVFIRDTLTDSGVEPYPGPGPMYLSPDIWVRHDPDPNHDPNPFSTVSPPWTPLPHQNPEYRNTKRGLPNYVYVRIHNRGDEASTGTERLRLYQAKASTGLNWPTQWVDDVGQICGADQLLGIEVTKPRKNGQTASVAERQAYRDALIEIATDTSYQYSDGVSYWAKQNQIHTNGNPQHGNPAFLPWHREMVNRFEQRLREADPLVTMLYWNFTTDPTLNNATHDSLFDNNFVGQATGTVTGTLASALPVTINRNVGDTATNPSNGQVLCGQALFSSDAASAGQASYPGVASVTENSPNHDCAHGFIGGYGGQFSPVTNVGEISSQATAVHDPFFFQLHGNVDRQWANWQRNGADPDRLDPVTVYGGNSSDSDILDTIAPWDGTSTAPWNGIGASTSKTSKHNSVVYPPIYDTAPLNIPVLEPGESVVIEVPWYPPNVNNYNCSGQAGHFCMLARIETEVNAPFGMAFPEVTNVSTNTQNNNNIAWKNLTIVDTQSDGPAFFITGTILRNVFDRTAQFEFRLIDRTAKRRFLLPEFAQVGIALPQDILKRIRAGDGKMEDLKFAKVKGREQPILQITGKEPRFFLPMKAGEMFTAELVVNIERERLPQELLVEPFLFDIEQRIDLPRTFFERKNRGELEVGGVRFTLDFAEALKDPNERDELLRLADLKLNLAPVERKQLKLRGTEPALVQHLSVGEPVELRTADDQGVALRKLSLDVDGREIASADRASELSEIIKFDEPGVHTITTRGIGEDGKITEQRTRVLVSESIPPDAVIASPGRSAMAKVGETIKIEVDTAAAFQREVKRVTMHVKDDTSFTTGFDLVRGDRYPVVDTREGPGPHTFEFTPERPGSYMVQFGVLDDADQLGESGHLMVMVDE